MLRLSSLLPFTVALLALVPAGTPVPAVRVQPTSQVTSDSTPPHLAPGRSRRDSIAFDSAVAYGRGRMATWPTLPDTLPESVLPSHRIVAYYGNPLSKRMGVLGQYPPDVMLAKLDTAAAEWQRADPDHPVIPALHMIAVIAQNSAGDDGMYRLRVSSKVIEKVYAWAQQKHALLFLDIQLGHSTVQKELPRLMPYLSRPDVHLAIDPEFSMHYHVEGVVPGRQIGQLDAKDINWASEQLQQLVTEKHLPPKVLVVHRFRRPMVLHASQIQLDPRVQIVMDMDGWGAPWMKFDSYRVFIDKEPVEFTGFKIFYHNDAKGHDRLLTPMEVLQLRPAPLYIQYQ